MLNGELHKSVELEMKTAFSLGDRLTLTKVLLSSLSMTPSEMQD